MLNGGLRQVITFSRVYSGVSQDKLVASYALSICLLSREAVESASGGKTMRQKFAVGVQSRVMCPALAPPVFPIIDSHRRLRPQLSFLIAE